MKREEVLEELNTIFCNNFDDNDIILYDEISSADIDAWDSLEQVNLVIAIQDKFNVKFNIDEVNAMENVGEMVDFIIEKTAVQKLNKHRISNIFAGIEESFSKMGKVQEGK